jgi:hypothetical protein
MVQLLKRRKATRNKKFISATIAEMQKTFYDEDLLQLYQEDNEEYLFWAQFDFLKDETIDCPTYYKIIGINHTDLNTFTQKLSFKLNELFEKINAKEFLVLSYLKLDFFGQGESDYPPLANAYRMLEKIVGAKTYNEAFAFNIKDLPCFVEILFWLIRCDPEVPPYIYLFDQEEKIGLNMCKYGNIHLTEFKIEKLTEDILQSLDWNIIKGPEYDPFSENGSIEGRQIKTVG